MSENQTQVLEIESAVVRFVGDSGDGMQLTGNLFSDSTAVSGNDVVTFPDFPAEIRAPAGTVGGVSGFQVNFSSNPVTSHGDAPDALVAMNPAALIMNVKDLKHGRISGAYNNWWPDDYFLPLFGRIIGNNLFCL